MALLFKQGAATEFALQDFEPTFGQKFGAVVDETLLENPTPVIANATQNLFENNPKLSADEAKSFLSQYPFQITAKPKDGEYSKEQLVILAERQRQLRIAQDIRDRTPWDYGSPIRALGMFGASLVDPINVASAFVPWTWAITGARALQAARVSSSAGTRFLGRAGLGAIDGGISTAAIEPFYALARTNIGDDYDALDSMANIAFGTVIGGGILGIGGVGTDAFRKLARREIPSDRFAGLSVNDIQLVQALDAELKAGGMMPSTLRAVLESYSPEMRRAAGFSEDLSDIKFRDPRSTATAVSRSNDGLSMTVKNRLGVVQAQTDGTNLQIMSARISDAQNGAALVERTVNEGIDNGMSVVSDAIVPSQLARAIEALEQKGFVVTRNPNAMEIEPSAAFPDGAVRSVNGEPVYRIERGETYQKPEQTAQDQVDIMSPDTREATFRAGVAQMLAGYGLSIEPIIKTDAAFPENITPADLKKNADLSLQPENIRAADFEASENIEFDNQNSQGWNGLSDAEAAVADADALLDQTIAAGDQAYKYSRSQGGADKPGVGVAAGNKLGFEPALRVRANLGRTKLPEKALILTGTTNQNAARQIDAIDGILARFPNAGDSIEEWSRMMAYAFASQEVPIPPYAFIRDVNSNIAATKLGKLTKGQIDDAAHGFEQAAAFRAAYVGKQLQPVTTGKLFMWSFLSRGVSPYTQEALFIDAFPGIDEFIRKAADGDFTEADFPAYEKWAKSVAPKGSGQPGAGAAHNLNAFGKSFLLKMGAKDENGVSNLQRLHQMMEDPNATGKEIRREFMKFGEGVGIDNKVVSFTLLVAGFDDLMVLDRVQIRQLFDDGRFGGKNLYDGRKEEGKVVTGSSLADLTMGARGLLLYEAIERTLTQKIEGIYGTLGRGQDASIGRYHWESWVADSQQEASHGTLGAILPDAKGDDQAIARVLAKQGEYGAYEYGAMYGRDENGAPFYQYRTPDGKLFEFNVPAFREFLTDIKRPKTGVVPTNFKVTESGNAPWWTRTDVNQARLSEVAAKWADRQGGTGEGARIVQAALNGENIPGGSGARYSRGAIRNGFDELEKLDQDGIDELLQSKGVAVNNIDEAEGLYANGYAIYASSEMDEIPFLINDRTLLQVYAPDQMLALSPDTIRSLVSMDEITGLPLNEDGTVTVYHHTSAQSAAKIRREGRLRSDVEPDVYVTTESAPVIGYGDEVVEINIDPSRLVLDDEFPSGRKDYRINVDRPGGSTVVNPAYARGNQPLVTAENANDLLASTFGRDTQTLIDAGQLQMVSKVSDLPSGPHPADVKAMTAPDGRVFVVAENVSPAEMRGIVLHEVGVHVGMERMLGADVFQSVLKDLDAATIRGETWAQAARDSVPEDTPRALIREEQLAYLVQNAPESPLAQRIIAAIRAWAFRTFKTARERMQLTEADFRSLAISGLKFVSRQQKQSAGELSATVPAMARETPIIRYKREAESITNILPEVPEGFTRLYRGNRPNEIGKNPQFTSDLAGIALPFADAYKGPVSYVDVPSANLQQYQQKIAATDVEFILPPNLAATAKQVARQNGSVTRLTPQNVIYARGAIEDTSTAKSELAAADAKVERAKSYAGVLRAAADKLENDAQAVEAMRSQMPDLTAQEIDELLTDLRTQVKNLRGMTRKAREELAAGDTAAALQSEAMQAADMLANNLQLAAAIERRNAALNLNARLKASSFINQFREKGLDFEGFAALLVGSERVRTGARISVDAEAKAFRGEFVGGLLADMEKAGLNQAFISGRFDRDLYDALWRMGSDTPDMTGLSPEVIKMAEIINKYQNAARNRRNRFGAWIRDLQGYITRQTHDMFKIRAATQDEWVNLVKDKIDLPKMIRLGIIDETDPIGSLRSMYNDFASGSHMKPMAAEEDIVALGRGSNLAKRESVSRTLYFKDGLAAYDYHAQFGGRRLAEEVLIGLDRSAMSASLLKTLGTNPEATLTRLLDEYEESLKTNPERFDKFRSQRGAIMNLLAQVDGTVFMPGNVTAAKVNAFLRSWTSMAKLGGALISSVSDLAGYAAELRYVQNKNMYSGLADSVGALLKGRAKGDRADILGSLGVFYESVSSGVSARFDSPELVNGKMAAAMQTFFRLNGLSWWTEVLRDGAALSHSHYMAMQSSKAFDAINPELRRLLTLYNIDAGKWDLMRMGKMQSADGKMYLTPASLRTLPQESLENYIRSVGRTVSPAAVENLIDDLSQAMRIMFLDRAHHAVLEPNARNRAFMLRGTKPGTVPGEILRYIGQFKSFSIAITQSVLGREVYGRGYDTLGEYLRKGRGDMLGLAHMIGLYGLLGYGAMSAKDLLKGREPRDPMSVQTVIASLAQGGGLGLYGDFLFGEYSRFGKSLVSSIAGPVAGAADTVAELYTRVRNGDDVAAVAFKALLDNTPFANLFWLRPLLDYAILFNIQESLNPGYLRRMERRVERQNEQRFLFKPSEVIR
jgi:hypothetical protein